MKGENKQGKVVKQIQLVTSAQLQEEKQNVKRLEELVKEQDTQINEL